MSNVLAAPPASAEQAAAYFAARLHFETNVSDVHADQEADVQSVVVDTRAAAAWEHGHLPSPVDLPTAEIPVRATQVVPSGAIVVIYCWGPGRNGATRAALAFATLGYQVKDGGYEYRVRQGFPVQTASGRRRRPVNDLTAVGTSCEC